MEFEMTSELKYFYADINIWKFARHMVRALNARVNPFAFIRFTQFFRRKVRADHIAVHLTSSYTCLKVNDIYMPVKKFAFRKYGFKCIRSEVGDNRYVFVLK